MKLAAEGTCLLLRQPPPGAVENRGQGRGTLPRTLGLKYSGQNTYWRPTRDGHCADASLGAKLNLGDPALSGPKVGRTALSAHSLIVGDASRGAIEFGVERASLILLGSQAYRAASNCCSASSDQACSLRFQMSLRSGAKFGKFIRQYPRRASKSNSACGTPSR